LDDLILDSIGDGPLKLHQLSESLILFSSAKLSDTIGIHNLYREIYSQLNLDHYFIFTKVSIRYKYQSMKYNTHELVIFNKPLSVIKKSLVSGSVSIIDAANSGVYIVIEYLSPSNRGKDAKYLLNLLARNSIPGYYIVNVKEYMITQYLLISGTTVYEKHIIDTSDLDSIFTLKPLDIKVCVRDFYEKP
ncbi:unnamed protein product, partial [Didymodactylos carnosus]